MNDEPTDRAERLAALWDGYVKPLVLDCDLATYEQDRVQEAFKILQAACIKTDNTNFDQQLKIFSTALSCLQLIASDLFYPLDWLFSEDNIDDELKDRYRCMVSLAMADLSLCPWLSASADPCLILLPRSSLSALRDGFEALSAGEVQSIFRPAVVARHAGAWSLDQAKSRAVQHVLFLHGQGVTKRIARQRVATAIGASSETLRGWEERDLNAEEAFKLAKSAGKLHADLSVDPEIWNESNSIDALLATTYEALKNETLSDFGRSFRVLTTKHGGK